MNPLKIAITGSAGSGKSIVCQKFGRLGLVTLDCDQIAREVVEPGTQGLNQIVELFGEQIIQETGVLDRLTLRRIIIDNPKMRTALEDILHPQILIEMIFQMENAVYKKGLNAVAVEVPLLFESGMDKHFDVTVAVLAEDIDLVSRISRRDNVASEDAKKMLNIQMPQEEKIKKADHVIINKGTRSELFDSVDYLFVKIKKEFLTRKGF